MFGYPRTLLTPERGKRVMCPKCDTEFRNPNVWDGGYVDCTGCGKTYYFERPLGPIVPDQRAVISGIDIPFTDLVAFMVKAAIAAIPAAFIIAILYTVIITVLGGSLASP